MWPHQLKAMAHRDLETQVSVGSILSEEPMGGSLSTGPEWGGRQVGTRPPGGAAGTS
jgi:hypothetical protein